MSSVALVHWSKGCALLPAVHSCKEAILRIAAGIAAHVADSRSRVGGFVNPPTPPWGVNRVKILRMKVEFMCKKKIAIPITLLVRRPPKGSKGRRSSPLEETKPYFKQESRILATVHKEVSRGLCGRSATSIVAAYSRSFRLMRSRTQFAPLARVRSLTSGLLRSPFG